MHEDALRSAIDLNLGLLHVFEPTHVVSVI